MKQLLRAEFTKFRTVRAWLITLAATVIVFVLLSFLSALESRAPVGVVPVGPAGEPVSDTYMFVHQALDSDGTITAQVTSLSGVFTSPPAWAKAGIILKPDTAQGTAYAAVMVTGGHGIRMQDDYIHDTGGLPGRVRPASPPFLAVTSITRSTSLGTWTWPGLRPARTAAPSAGCRHPGQAAPP